jgi:hypothetical protein
MSNAYIILRRETLIKGTLMGPSRRWKDCYNEDLKNKIIKYELIMGA